MHKLFIGGALFIALAAVTGCDKSASNSNFYQKESTKAPEKDAWATDAELIAAIKGQTAAYAKILDLEDYLYDNARLSDDVIHSLIEEQRVPNHVVETALVLSAPISTNAMSLLAVKRPGLSTTAITAANNVPASVGYAIINSSPRKIVFGNDIEKRIKPGSGDCGCGEGVIAVGSNHKLVVLTSTTPAEPSDPAEAKPCNSDNVKWTCGDVVYADLTGTDGSSANYNITCRQSTARCFKNPRNARRDY